MTITITGSGIAHALRNGGGILCHPTSIAAAVTGGEPTCLNCLKILKRMHDQDELKKMAHLLPMMVRGGDGKIRLRRMQDDSRITDKLTPFVTMAAAEQWLEMAKKANVDFANISNIP